MSLSCKNFVEACHYLTKDICKNMSLNLQEGQEYKDFVTSRYSYCHFDTRFYMGS